MTALVVVDEKLITHSIIKIKRNILNTFFEKTFILKTEFKYS